MSADETLSSEEFNKLPKLLALTSLPFQFNNSSVKFFMFSAHVFS